MKAKPVERSTLRMETQFLKVTHTKPLEIVYHSENHVHFY